VFFPAEAGAAVTAVAGLDKNFHLIDKHNPQVLRSGRGRNPKKEQRQSLLLSMFQRCVDKVRAYDCNCSTQTRLPLKATIPSMRE
jgi:hypothetical protein